MKVPRVTVVVRYVKSDSWKDGFPIPCIKYGSDKYSSMYEVEKTFKEDVIFQGEIPGQLRILPFVDPKYLRGYMHFYSQLVPHGLNKDVADAIRGTCPIHMFGSPIHIFDHECYHPSGKIISCSIISEHSDEVKAYLTQFIKKEDWDRIDRFGVNFDDWGHEYYKKEKV